MELLSKKKSPRIGLLLGGGGARAAYQVGVLKAYAEIFSDQKTNPFPVICGTSAGGINAAVVASYADHFQVGIKELVRVWSSFKTDKVFRTDYLNALSRGFQWVFSMFTGGAKSAPKSLFDVTPLRCLLETHVSFEKLDQSLSKGNLSAISVTASSYSTGRSISFFQTHEDIENWERVRRKGRLAELSVDHLMASAAIPILFPAVQIDGDYYGDGSMRQNSPISPALHLGADKVLIIGVRQENPSNEDNEREPGYPKLGQIAGYVLDTLFLNSLSADIERLERINQTLELVKDKKKTHLKHIETLLISPSEDIAEIAEAHYHEFPKSMKYLLSILGVRRGGGRRLISYLLFEKSFCDALIDLGYRDAMNRKQEIIDFMEN